MTKLLQIPQKSGLNQNNIMVASATEQQIQSRAIIDIGSATLPLPIICTTQLYGVKTDGTILNQAQVVCNSSQRIHVAINVQTGHPFSTVSQALLLIKKVSGSGSFAVFPATANNVVQSGAEATNFVTELTLGSDVYFAIDITAQVRNNAAKMIYLAICSESGSSCTLCSHLHTNKPGIDVAFVKEDPDFSEIVPIEDAIGANGAYSVNVRNGKLMYTQRVYQAPGGYLPFALSMSYCATDYATAAPNNVTRPLTGWIFNYDQSIRVIGNNLIYLDGNHRYHEFVPAGNSSTVWSNATAKDGTYIIQKSDGTYQLTDGKAMTMNFNTDNRLAEIVAPNSQKIEITYTGGNISQIVVGSQATYTLTYSSQTITLKKGNVVLSTITLNSAGRPTAVTNGQTDNGYTFAYNGSQLLSKVTDIASKQVAEFAYNTAKGVASVKRNIKNPTEQASSAVFFTYDNKRTIVSHCRNTHSVGAAYKKMEYLFAEDGTLLDSFERIGIDKYNGLSFKDKDDYMFHYSRINGSPYWNVDFNGQKSISLKTTSVSNAQVSTAEKIIPGSSLTNQCVLTGQAFIASSNYVPDGGSGKIAIYLMEDGVELCHLEFDGNSRERQVLSKAFELTDESHTVKVIAKIENMRADVLLDNIKLIPLLGSAVTEFTTGNTGKDNHEDPDVASGIIWYEKGLVHFNHGGINLAENVKYTQKDHLLTMQSKAKNPTNFNVWYNDGANVLCGVDDNIEIQFAGKLSGYLRDHTFCSRTFAPGKVIYSYPTIDTNFKVLTVTYTSVAKFVAEQHFNARGQVVKEIDQDGVVTTYTYNSDGQLTKTRVEASGSLMNIEQSNTYYDNKMLKSTVEKRESSTYSQLYFYGTNLELTSETFPNGLSHYYTYSPSNDMLTTISTTQSNADPKNVIAYDGDLVTRLTHNGTTFCFAYDTQNNIDSVQIEGASTAIISKEITYDSSGTTQSVTTYGNGQVIKKYYDKYDRLIKISSIVGGAETDIASFIYSDEAVYDITDPEDSSLSISASSKLRCIVDHIIGRTTEYEYDEQGNITSYFYNFFNKDFIKDSCGRPYMDDISVNGKYITNYYTYKNTNTSQLQSEVVRYEGDLNKQITTTYTTDTLGRPTKTRVTRGGNGIEYDYYYMARSYSPPDAGGTTQYLSYIKEHTITNNEIVYTNPTVYVSYDFVGNITRYGSTYYQYDQLGRLVRENNSAIDKTIIWSYDVGGNITSRTEYAYTTGSVGTATATYTYEYDDDIWKDKLIRIDKNGSTWQSISYDNAGNPTVYGDARMTWSNGRNLTSYYIPGNGDYFDMKYSADGKRVQKTQSYDDETSDYVTTYIYDGNNLVCEQEEDGSSTHSKYFLYNSQGLVGFVYAGTVYTYRKNLFGDIVAIYNGSTKVAEYAYDAYGKCTIVTDTYNIARANPFRYRGYYWDSDLELYYLMSRYYDPQTGRFINADSLEYLDSETIGGLNLYSYCGNNPVMYADPSGHIAISTLILCSLALIGLGLTIGGVASDNNLMTAIGLTMVAIPALVSGIGALFSGAIYLSIIGGITATAGLFTGVFASAEYQEAFMGNNWMLDAGMSEEWYNGLMLATATIATAGTMATHILTGIGNSATHSQMMNSFNKHPKRWKVVKELIEPGIGKNKGGISTYTNYINKWTGSKLGVHKIIRGGRFIHGPHFHPWI
ncbi:MAG: hypothetical protein IKD26_06100 [Clostridia bacterium]|nr:hypothetical protein [Clostridia bacterium]